MNKPENETKRIYPPDNAASQLANTLGITLYKYKEKNPKQSLPITHIKTHLESCLALIRWCDSPAPKEKELNKLHEKINSTYLKNSDNSWIGGSYTQLQEALGIKPSKTPLPTYKKQNSFAPDIKSLLTEIIPVKPARKRQFNETCGEYDHDRRYDLYAYVTTKRVAQPVTSIKLDCLFNFTATIKDKSINEYGQAMWHINDAIESAGITTHLTIGNLSRANAQKYNLSIDIKKPDEYLSPSTLASIYTSNFYRRVMFALRILGIYAMTNYDCDHIGISLNSKPVQYLNGCLQIASNPYNQFETFKNELKQALLNKPPENKGTRHA